MSDDNDFGRLRTRLADLADAPAPASPFDPVRTAGAGRRRMLALRTSAVGGTGALALAATFGIMTAFGPAGPSAPPSAASTHTSGIGADPLAAFVDFGWLPASLPYKSYQSSMFTSDSSTISEVTAQGDVNAPGGAPRVDMKLLPGNGPGTPNAHERFIPVKLDDGRQAYWLTQSSSGGEFAGDFQLRFPMKSGRWVSITWGVKGAETTVTNYSTVRGVPTDPTASSDSAPPTSVPVSKEWQQTLLHMAVQVTDTPAQIPMPLRVAGLPAGFQPSEAFLWRPGEWGRDAPGTWTALLVFFAPGGEVAIDVGPHGTVADTSAKGTTCTTAAGLDACVEVTGHNPAFEKLGGAKGLLKRVTLLGPDEKQWTSDVLVP